jgi:hypothetical protein
LTDRKLSPKEVAALGLERKVPHEEAQQLGLEKKPPSIWEKAAEALPDFSPKGRAGAALRGFGQGEGYGFVDELRGLQGAGDALYQEAGLPGHHVDVVRQPNEALSAYLRRSYGSERDAARKEDAEADAAHPGYFRGAQVVGALASPSPTGKGALARLAIGGLQGAAAGMGGSDAADTGDNLKDAGKGLALGVGGAGVGEGVGVARGFFRKGIDRARGIINEKNEARIAEELRSMNLKAASEAQKAARGRENMGNLKEQVSIPLAARINRYLDSPDAASHAEHLAEDALERAPGRDQAMHDAAMEYQLAKQEAPARLGQMNKAAEETPVVLPRLKRYAGRAIGAGVGAAVGSEVAGPEHRGAGAAFGSMLGTALLGKPGTSFGNMVSNPAFSVKAGKAGEAIANVVGRVPVATAEAGAQDLGRPLTDEQRQALASYLAGLGR